MLELRLGGSTLSVKAGGAGSMYVRVRLHGEQRYVFRRMLRTTGWGVIATCTIRARHCGQFAAAVTASE